MRRLSLLALLLASCAPPGVESLRERALADLQDAEKRDAAADTLAWIHIAHDGDAALAAKALTRRASSPEGDGAVTAALVASAEGNLGTEIAAWVTALETGSDDAATLALVRLAALADYVPEAAHAPILKALGRARGPARFVAESLRADLTRQPTPTTLTTRAQWSAEQRPWAAFRDRRAVEPAAPSRDVPVVDDEVAIGNRGSALAAITFDVSGAGTWLAVQSKEALRVTVSGKEVLSRDPLAGWPAEVLVTWLPPGAATVRIDVAASSTGARLGLRLLPGPSDALSEPKTPIALLARASLAVHARDRSDALRWLARLETAAPKLAHAHLLRAAVPDVDPGAARKKLAIVKAAGHAGVDWTLAQEAIASGRAADAKALLAALRKARDPRSALAEFRVLRDVGWQEDAEAALARARELAPQACEPAREAFQHHYDRVKLRGEGDLRRVLETRCLRDAAVPGLLAGLAAETGQLGVANDRLRAEAERRHDPTLRGADRVRVLERLGQKAEALRLAGELADLSEADLDPHFRLGDVSSALGDAELAKKAFGRAARLGLSAPDVRLRLAAVAPEARVWERFDPDVDAILREPLPADLTAGRVAVLLVDHNTTLRFKDGGSLHHVHQVMRLLTPQGVEELGEGGVPEDAVVLRAVTRKADGRVLEPEDIAQKDTVSFAELEVGDAIELSYLTASGPDGSLGGEWLGESFYFQIYDVPSWRGSYVVLAQDGTSLKFEPHHLPEAAEAVSAPGFTGWRWSTRGKPAATREHGDVAPFDRLPRVQVWSGFGWDHLLATYEEQLLRLLAPDDRLRALAASLAPSDGDRLAGARALFDAVRREVKEDDSALLDVPAAKALATGAGERPVTLLALLRAAGYTADYALIDPIHREHEPSAVPDVRDFSYPIVRLRLGEQVWWLDTTFDGTPFGFVPPTVRGRPAWVVGQAPEKVATPAEPGVDERRHVQVDFAVGKDGAVEVLWREESRGMDAVAFREGLAPLSESERKRALGDIAGELLAGLKLNALVIDHLDDPGRALAIRMGASLEPSGSGGPGKLALGLVPNDLQRRFVHLRARKTPLFVSRQEDQELEVTVKLAPGVEPAEALPAKVVWEGSFGRYERTVTRDGATIRVRKRFHMAPQIVGPDKYPQFMAFCRTIDGADRLVLRLQGK